MYGTHEQEQTNTETMNRTRQRSFIYGLVDPRDLVIRYVGRTASGLPKRLGQHLAPSKLAQETPLAAWLRELVALEEEPIILMLASVTEDSTEKDGEAWRQAEQKWIVRLRTMGADLLNGNEGGTGPCGGYRLSAESVAKMVRAKVGRGRSGGSSSFPGVSWHKATGRWTVQYRNRYLGTRNTEEQAFTVYVQAYRADFGGDVPGWEGWKPATPDSIARIEIGKPIPTPKTV